MSESEPEPLTPTLQWLKDSSSLGREIVFQYRTAQERVKDLPYLIRSKPLEYWAGPHIEKGIRDLGTLSGWTLSTFGPGAALRGSMDHAAVAEEAIRQGNYTEAAAMYALSLVAAAGVYVPGSVPVSKSARYVSPKRPLLLATEQTTETAASNLISAQKSKSHPYDKILDQRTTGNYYSVAHSMKLDKKFYPGVSRRHHYRQANRSLIETMEKYDDYANALNNIGVYMQRNSRQGIPEKPSADWSWHHALEEGEMHLVPRSQHGPGSGFQRGLHPTGTGGYSDWGVE